MVSWVLLFFIFWGERGGDFFSFSIKFSQIIENDDISVPPLA